MIIILAGLILGAAVGAGVARRRGGRGLDQAQYAAGYAIAFGILAVFLTVLLARMA